MVGSTRRLAIFAMNAKRTAMTPEGGFTLAELMVALAVAAILVTLAVPSYQRLVVDARMTAQANEFLTMMHFARSEAVKRNATVTMCKSDDGAACATSGTWAQGWMVFVDSGAAGTVDGGDAVLRVHGALTDESALVDCTGPWTSFPICRPGTRAPRPGIFSCAAPTRTSAAGTSD